MKLRQRKKSGSWYVDVRWKGYSRIQMSTGTNLKSHASAIAETLQRLKHIGRRDVLEHIANGSLNIGEAHELYMRDISRLDARIKERTSKTLGELTNEWIESIRLPSTLSSRRKPYARSTVARYEQSLQSVYAGLPRGRESRLEDITKGFVADYRKVRRLAGRTGATINRDLNTIKSFWGWLERSQEIAPERFKIETERESDGRDRWLDANEIEAVRAVCPPSWWTLFLMLIQTGMRVSEAQGLRWADIRFADEYIDVNSRHRSLKSTTSNRQTFLQSDLAALLMEELRQRPCLGTALVFSDSRGNRQNAYRMWQRVVKKAGIESATVHDLRHTFGVHATRSGIPLATVQHLMGHATPAMTLRYMKHCPDTYRTHNA